MTQNELYLTLAIFMITGIIAVTTYKMIMTAKPIYIYASQILLLISAYLIFIFRDVMNLISGQWLTIVGALFLTHILFIISSSLLRGETCFMFLKRDTKVVSNEEYEEVSLLDIFKGIGKKVEPTDMVKIDREHTDDLLSDWST